jgi:hypothetical protein
MMTKFYSTLIAVLVFFVAHGEGSREFNASTNTQAYRTFLSYTTPVTGSALGWYPVTTQDSVESRSYLYVYAQLNDSICVASSALGVGSGAIRVYRPDGSLFVTYTTAPGDTGLILAGAGSKARENAGPYGYYNGGAGGYIPRLIIAGQAGIWRVEFLPPNPNTSSSNYFSGGTLVPKTTADFLQPNNNCIISAFDVSIVRNRNVIRGRVYTDYLSLSGGDLRRTTGGAQYYFTENYTFYILTKQGYRYDLTMNGLAPYGYFLYADNVGLQLADGITPAYESISYQPTRPANRRILRPGDPDTYSESKHKMFFNSPDPTMPVTALLNNQTVWLNPPLINSTGIIVLRYTVTGSPNPMSGFFTFEYPNLGIRYKIIIDANSDNVYGTGSDVVLSGTSVIGENTISWNGSDALGNILPNSTCVNARIEFIAGEIHTPLADAENFRGGIEIRRINGNGTLPNYTVHWNDSSLNDNTNLSPSFVKKTPPSGVSSLGGTHAWERQEAPSTPTQGYTGNPTHPAYYGDTRYMDIWAYDTLQTQIFPAAICYVLPLRLLSFTGYALTTGNQLQWRVSLTHQEGVDFTLQRKTPGGFENIGSLAASGMEEYTFTDRSAPDGDQYYRLQIRQRNGSIIYSNILKIGGNTPGNGVQVYPNPTAGLFLVRSASGIRSITLTDASGKVVLQVSGIQGNRYEIDGSKLSPSVYYIKLVTQQNQIINTRINIQ